MTGQTKDAGWQVGARRTIPPEFDEAWDLLTSPPWLQRWSGLTALDAGDSSVRSLTARRVVRVRTSQSLVQLRLLPAASGTTVAFHEDQLPDEHARSQRKDHWAQLLDDLEVMTSTRQGRTDEQRTRRPEIAAGGQGHAGRPSQ